MAIYNGTIKFSNNPQQGRHDGLNKSIIVIADVQSDKAIAFKSINELNLAFLLLLMLKNAFLKFNQTPICLINGGRLIGI